MIPFVEEYINLNLKSNESKITKEKWNYMCNGKTISAHLKCLKNYVGNGKIIYVFKMYEVEVVELRLL